MGAATQTPPQPRAATSDRYLTSVQVAALDGVAVTPATVVDWIVTGLVVPDESDPKGVRKRRVQLPARKVGGRWKVKEADATVFIDRITRLNLPNGQPDPDPPSVAEKKRRGEKSRADFLKRIGRG